MKKKLSIFLLLTLLVISCKNKCHRIYYIYNNSNKAIWYVNKYDYPPDKCLMTGKFIEPNQKLDIYSRTCIEKSLGKNGKLEFYLIDTSKYLFDVPINCDSLLIKNKVLQEISINLNELKKSDFKIYYP